MTKQEHWIFGAVALLFIVVALFGQAGCGTETPQADPGGVLDASDENYRPSPDTGDAEPAEESRAEPVPRWTVLVFMCADNNLEKQGLEDIEQMMEIPDSDYLNVLVEVDRAEGFYSLGLGALENWTTAKRLQVRHGQVLELDDLGEINMGSAKALHDFLVWGLTSYPADRTILILWDHGQAWLGYGGDESANYDLLSQPEFTQAIADALAEVGVDSLALVGFDACLMANCGTAMALSEFTRYLVASEEKEPGTGWDYTRFKVLVDHPEISVEELGHEILDAYLEECEDPSTATLGLLDLEGMASVSSALESWVLDAIQDIALHAPAIGAARTGAERFGYHANPRHNSNLVDLHHFVQLQIAADPALEASGTALLEAAEQVVALSRLSAAGGPAVHQHG